MAESGVDIIRSRRLSGERSLRNKEIVSSPHVKPKTIGPKDLIYLAPFIVWF